MKSILKLQTLENEATRTDSVFGANSWISVASACWRRRNCP